MPDPTLSLSTDQVAAFVELARAGSLRKAADGLLITEQGVRNRLLALEARLGVELYRKSRGPRRAGPLTADGQRFLPHAVAFLERADELRGLFSGEDGRQREVHVAATQYLILYVLIDAVRRFHAAYPHIHVRLSNHTEQEVEQALLEQPAVSLGVAAPYEASPELDYVHLFSLDWGLIAPPGHPLRAKKRLDLKDLAAVPLILFERGSTGRQHVVDAFHEAGCSPTSRWRRPTPKLSSAWSRRAWVCPSSPSCPAGPSPAAARSSPGRWGTASAQSARACCCAGENAVPGRPRRSSGSSGPGNSGALGSRPVSRRRRAKGKVLSG